MTSESLRQHTFEFRVLGPDMPGDEDDIFGVWKVPAAFPAPLPAFGEPRLAAATGILWRAGLHAELRQAYEMLAQAESKLAISVRNLFRAEARLNAFVEKKCGNAGFWSTGSYGENRTPEAYLEHFFRDLVTQGPSPAFGSAQGDHQTIPEMAKDFLRFLERSTAVVGENASVETWLGEHLVGRTALSWDGDVGNVVESGLVQGQSWLHLRAVALALRSQVELTQHVATIVRSAATLATLFVVPGSSILALATAWQFIREVLAEG
jgi:hypothetical protein